MKKNITTFSHPSTKRNGSKVFLPAMALLIMLFGCSTKKTPVLLSGQKEITYKVDQKLSGWLINPELKPDRLRVECGKDPVEVQFISDVDEVKFSIKKGDTVRFNVLLNATDTALTEIVGSPKNVNFTPNFVKKNQDRISVEIPEVHELMMIMIAITEAAKGDPNMVDQTTGYYKKVMEHFEAFKEHRAIDTMNIYFPEPYNYNFYYITKMNASGYAFDNNDDLINNMTITNMTFPFADDFVSKHKELIEDFARKSNFRQFYSTNQDYYNELIKTFNRLNPTTKMNNWLAKRFSTGFGSYRVVFSPLVGGAHNTQQYHDIENGFSQTVMYVNRAKPEEKYSDTLNEIIASRKLFTEIDHNFTSSLTSKYLTEINDAFSQRDKWVDSKAGDKYYGSPMGVFAEYITWALYSLYLYDNYNTEDAHRYVEFMEKQMEKNRYFIQFKAFNQQLIELYNQDKNADFDQIYNKILQWCSQINKS